MKEQQNVVSRYSVELLSFKYRRQNISVSVTLVTAVTVPKRPLLTGQCSCPYGTLDRAKTRETLNFIAPTLWPPNSPELNPTDYRIWEKLQERVYRRRITNVAYLKSRFIEERERKFIFHITTTLE